MSASVLHPEQAAKNLMPPILAGILSIYGLVLSLMISQRLSSHMSLYAGLLQLAAGMSVGLGGLAAGFAIGIVGCVISSFVCRRPSRTFLFLFRWACPASHRNLS
jgi:ATP synthase proteolipid subunit